MKHFDIALFLAPGFEEIEAITTIDVLRRAGFHIATVAVGTDSLLVTGAHDITVTADVYLQDLNPDKLRLTICPGGLPGATNLRDAPAVVDAIRSVVKNNGYAAAICAAPIVLHKAGVLNGKKYTCYPSFEKQIDNATYTAKPVQVDGKIITACGPGASIQFALEIVRQLGNPDTAEKLKSGMLA